MLKYMTLSAGLALSALCYTPAPAADLVGQIAGALAASSDVQPYCKEWRLLPFEQRNCGVAPQSGGGSGHEGRPTPNYTVVTPPPPPPPPPCDPGDGEGDGDNHGHNHGHGHGPHGSTPVGPGGSVPPIGTQSPDDDGASDAGDNKPHRGGHGGEKGQGHTDKGGSKDGGAGGQGGRGGNQRGGK